MMPPQKVHLSVGTRALREQLRRRLHLQEFGKLAQGGWKSNPGDLGGQGLTTTPRATPFIYFIFPFLIYE